MSESVYYLISCTSDQSLICCCRNPNITGSKLPSIQINAKDSMSSAVHVAGGQSQKPIF